MASTMDRPAPRVAAETADLNPTISLKPQASASPTPAITLSPAAPKSQAEAAPAAVPLSLEEQTLADRVRVEVERTMQRQVKGLEYISTGDPAVGLTPKGTIYGRGTLKLYHYRAQTAEIYRVPVLLVMSLVSKPYILDLTPGQSLVEYLLRRGYDVFMIDWEAPRPDEKTLDLASYVLDFLPSCVARVKQVTGEPDISVIGYCFGGVLALLWAALHPEAGLKNLATFTTPVDFSKMPLFAAWSDKRYFDVDRLVDTLGNCPPEMLSTAFDSLRPGGRLAANLRLADRMWDDEFVKAHRMIDRWSSDMLPLAGAYFRDTTQKLMWDNALLNKTMDVAGRPVDLDKITVPFLHVTAEHDHIVPTAASAPLIEMIGSVDKEHVTLKGGHVSLIGGPNAVRRMWPKLDEWLAEKSL